MAVVLLNANSKIDAEINLPRKATWNRRNRHHTQSINNIWVKNCFNMIAVFLISKSRRLLQYYYPPQTLPPHNTNWTHPDCGVFIPLFLSFKQLFNNSDLFPIWKIFRKKSSEWILANSAQSVVSASNIYVLSLD